MDHHRRAAAAVLKTEKNGVPLVGQFLNERRPKRKIDVLLARIDGL
jgi:hypothetical protein